MSLAVRLLLALGLVAVFVTAVVGFAAREVSREQVERGFEQRIDAAMRGARSELVWEGTTLEAVLAPLCEHDSFVDRTLLDLQRADGDVKALPPARSIALRELVPEQAKALRLDRLVLMTPDGLVLGASEEGLVGTRDRSAARRLEDKGGRLRVLNRGGVAQLEVQCIAEAAPFSLALVGAREVDAILQRTGRAFGVQLALDPADLPPDGPGYLSRRLRIPEVPGLEVHAAVSRQPLFEALAQIDSSMILTGSIALLLSVALAVLVARSLSQPIVELATQTRAVVRGDPQPVRGRGGRELKQLARTFNRTIDELHRMRQRLARTERIAARREVARQVAHEIKNPLAPIRAAVETLRRLRDRGSPKFDDYFDEATRTVLGEVHRITSIVSEFTKFARMPPPAFERVDLVEVARGVVALHADPEGGDDGPEVTLAGETSLAVLADRDQLTQVLTNLVQNGLEASRDAELPLRVDIAIAREGDREARLTVTDHGPGIDPSVAERLFEPYVTTKAEGTGLGLAIVQTILHEHGGEIRLADAPDEGGARFVIILPIDGPPLLTRAPTHDTA